MRTVRLNELESIQAYASRENVTDEAPHCEKCGRLVKDEDELCPECQADEAECRCEDR